MGHIVSKFEVIFSILIGCLVYNLGGSDLILHVLLLFIVLDYLTGVFNAIFKKRLSSKTGFEGIYKKVLTLIIVAVAYNIQLVVDSALPLREIVVSFFIANEGISILENCSEMGIKFPQKIVDVLVQIRNNERGSENDT